MPLPPPRLPLPQHPPISKRIFSPFLFPFWVFEPEKCVGWAGLTSLAGSMPVRSFVRSFAGCIACCARHSTRNMKEKTINPKSLISFFALYFSLWIPAAIFVCGGDDAIHDSDLETLSLLYRRYLAAGLPLYLHKLYVTCGRPPPLSLSPIFPPFLLITYVRAV